MTGARISHTLDDKAFQAGVQRLGGVIGPPLLRAIGTGLVEQTQGRFESGRDVWGTAWQALNPAYAAIKRGPGILRASRMLQRSVTYQEHGATLLIGSNRVYAGVHQFGATIRPVRAKALVFRMGGVGPRGGPGYVRVQSVTIPARPYLGFGPNDQRAAMEVLAVFVGRAFSG